ncbi:HDOD domain-containing protein [bacterium]|nr:HDOD domain-containing protein [bacterium]
MVDEKVREKVGAFLSDVKQIPTLPDVYLRVKKAFEDPSLSVDYLADAIRYDQSLTISILRLANSPLFGFRHKISSISQAIMLIGLREVYSLVLSISVMGLFPVKEDDKTSVFPAKEFWKHSLGVAIASKTLGTMMGHPYPEELFVAGLIHDIGIMIEKMILGKKFDEICIKAKKENKFFLEAEVESLGFTHSEVGHILTETWKFPSSLIEATAHHHHPVRAKDSTNLDTIAVVHVAESLIRGLRIGWAGDPFVTPVDLEALKRLHLVPFNEMDTIVSKIITEYDAAVSTLIS